MKQFVIKNNVIDIYLKLKNDKEKSNFLLKIFKYLIENENFETNEKIELAFLGIKPSLKLIENWGGDRKNNTSQNQVDSKLVSSCYQDGGQVEINSLISNKDIKNKDIKNKDIKNKDIKKEETLENSKNDFVDYQFVEEEYKKGEFDFDLSKFWNFWKDKGLRKADLTNRLISWDIKDRDKRKMQNITQMLGKQMQVNKELKYQQELQRQEQEEHFYL